MFHTTFIHIYLTPVYASKYSSEISSSCPPTQFSRRIPCGNINDTPKYSLGKIMHRWFHPLDSWFMIVWFPEISIWNVESLFAPMPGISYAVTGTKLNDPVSDVDLTKYQQWWEEYEVRQSVFSAEVGHSGSSHTQKRRLQRMRKKESMEQQAEVVPARSGTTCRYVGPSELFHHQLEEEARYGR